METIIRKSMLRKTGVEYGDYAMNHVLGCSHGCKFPCYAQMQMQRFGLVKSYDDWCKPKLVGNTLELLDKEIPKLKDKIKSVQLCFTTDPFMLCYPEVKRMSINAIRKLNDAGIKCVVLTKGILPIELAELSKINEYGITLVSVDENFRKKYEPNTAMYESRIGALKALHDEGCMTWVSIEPYPTPNISDGKLSDVLNEICFVDRLVFGRWNYNKEIDRYVDCKGFYEKCVDEIKLYAELCGIQYHIKDGTI